MLEIEPATEVNKTGEKCFGCTKITANQNGDCYLDYQRQS
jgi:hypothetical protein